MERIRPNALLHKTDSNQFTSIHKQFWKLIFVPIQFLTKRKRQPRWHVLISVEHRAVMWFQDFDGAPNQNWRWEIYLTFWCGAGRWIGFPSQESGSCTNPTPPIPTHTPISLYHRRRLEIWDLNKSFFFIAYASKHTDKNPNCWFVIKVISITPSAIRLSPIWPDRDLFRQERKVKPNTHLAFNALCQLQFGPSQETQ